MFLSIDIGNTWQKIAIYDGDSQQIDYFQSQQLTIEKIQPFLEKYDIKAAIYSSVGQENRFVIDWLSTQVKTLTFSKSLKLPIDICYGTPDTLGTDRIASAIGGHFLFPKRPVLVIQAGTCLVTDFVNREGKYLGGSISPGLQMRLEALHHFTARLPIEKPQTPVPLIGTTTRESILSGVIYGLTFEIDGFIQQYGAQYPDLSVILTGGDAPMLSKLIKNSIFAAQNLVLLGLHKTLLFNVSET